MNAELKADLKRFEGVLTRHESGRSIREKFRDFVELSYCAIAKTMAPDEPITVEGEAHLGMSPFTLQSADALEDRYMRIVNSYKDKDAIRAYPEALAILSKWNHQYVDFSGIAAGHLGSLSDDMGQFFTPGEVGHLMAQMTLDKESVRERVQRQGYITFGEDAAGAGGLVLAAAEVMKNEGFDPSEHMLAHTRDISRIAYEMCYVQLSLAGIPARVVHGDTLRMQTTTYSWTPASAIFHNRHGHLSFTKVSPSEAVANLNPIGEWRNYTEPEEAESAELQPEPPAAPLKPEPDTPRSPRQLTLF